MLVYDVTVEEVEGIAADWVGYHHAEKSSVQQERTWYAVQLLLDFMYDEPEIVWRLILAILAKDQSNRTLENLSAGPVEDLLSKHGALVIERVERHARMDPTFARMLGGVWKSTMQDEIWNRVRQVWNRRGWDGLPE